MPTIVNGKESNKDDIESPKSIVEDAVQRAKDPFGQCFSDQIWLQKVNDALLIQKRQKPLSNDLIRTYFYVLDAQLQLAFAIKNLSRAEEYLNEIDQLLFSIDHQYRIGDDRNFDQFVDYAQTAIYYRAAACMLLQLKKSPSFDNGRMRLAMLCLSVAANFNHKKYDVECLEMMRMLETIEIGTMLNANAQRFNASAEIPKLTADCETPKKIHKILFGSVDNHQLTSFIATQSIRTAPHPITFSGYLKNLKPMLKANFFANRLLWILYHNQELLNDRLDIVDAYFPHMALSADNLDESAPESLCLLDIKVFLVTHVKWTQLRCQFSGRRRRDAVPIVVYPPFVDDISMIEQQKQFWQGVISTVYSNRQSNTIRDYRITLANSLDALRLNSHNTNNIRLVDRVGEWLMQAATVGDSRTRQLYRIYANRYRQQVIHMIQSRNEYDISSITSSPQRFDMFPLHIDWPVGKEFVDIEDRNRFIGEDKYCQLQVEDKSMLPTQIIEQGGRKVVNEQSTPIQKQPQRRNQV